MSSLGPSTLPLRPRRPPPRRRAARTALRLGLGIALVAAVFAAGLALGEALHDNPKPGVTITGVRTLKPLPLPPIHRTVTVTTSAR